MNNSAARERETVFVVDDDRDMRVALLDLLTAAGHPVQSFETAVRAREAVLMQPPGCIVLDVRMPGLSGLQFQKDLVSVDVPVIFMTGHADVQMSVDAMKQGAFDFLTKPFREQQMLDAVEGAILLRESRREELAEVSRLNAARLLLTERETTILSRVCVGDITKTIARDLRLSDITIKKSRANIMRKLGAASFAQLVIFADRLNLIK